MKLNTILLLFCFILGAAGCDRTERIYLESSLEILWGVESNFRESNRSWNEWIIRNTGGADLGADGWEIYFNFLRDIVPESVPPEITIEHINGDFMRLAPAEGFPGIPAGEEYRFSVATYGSIIKEIYAPDGFYIVYDNNRIERIHSDVIPFTRPEQMNRGPDDLLPVPLADVRFEQNRGLTGLPLDETGPVTPTPAHMEKGGGEFQLASGTRILYEDGLESEAGFLADRVAEVAGFRPALERGAGGGSDPVIILRTGDPGGPIPEEHNRQEAYRLQVEEGRVTITGATPPGVFYGIQTLRLLLDPGGRDKTSAQRQTGLRRTGRQADPLRVDAVTVVDAPRFRYRGLHLDVARNFQPMETVKRVVDLMALYKLNTFHFHLTDDEGWRLESTAFPELTEIGGRRGHDPEQTRMLYPSYGSGPDPEGATMGSGWYSREQYLELLRYARERHIEVIPEIDVPGHARAALVAMKERYRRLMEEGRQEEADRYRIHDPADESVYRSIQRWKDNVINVCQESTYRFLEVIFDELIDLHEEAGLPLRSIHIGADEVPAGVWTQSPECNELIASSDELESTDQLQVWFFRKVHELLRERNLIMSGWEEIALVGYYGMGKILNPEFAGSARPYVWSNIWGSGTEEYTYRLANAGYEVVLSHASDLYLDMAYDKHPQEAGYHWADFVATSRPFRFMPFHLYKNAIQTSMGHPIAEDAYRDAEQLTAEGRTRILGIQGQLWAETFRDPGRVEYMAFPRMIVLAERAWTRQPEWAEIEEREVREARIEVGWNEFANRLALRELPRLDRLHGGVGYRLPPPGARIVNNRLEANVEYPGLEIRYTLDGSEPTAESPLWQGAVEVEPGSSVKLRSFALTGRGSRTVTLPRDPSL